MQSGHLNHFSMLLSAVAVIATIAIGIYMAQPWGDNYAYEQASGYVGLVLFLTWAISPYIYFFRGVNKHNQSVPMSVTGLIAAFLVCIGGICLLVDTVFFSIDAQGALIFIFLPVYQWLLIGVFYGIGRIWASVGAR